MRVPYTGKPAPSKFQVEKLGSCRKLRLGPPSFCVAVTLGELLNPTSGVDKLLLTSEERVAGRADTNLDVLLRRTGLVGSTTGAGDHRIVVLWVNFIFHGRRVRLKNLRFRFRIYTIGQHLPSRRARKLRLHPRAVKRQNDLLYQLSGAGPFSAEIPPLKGGISTKIAH